MLAEQNYMDHKEVKFSYFGENWLQLKLLKMKKLECTEEMQESCSPRRFNQVKE